MRALRDRAGPEAESYPVSRLVAKRGLKNARVLPIIEKPAKRACPSLVHAFSTSLHMPAERQKARMFTESFLRDKIGATLSAAERARLERAISEVKILEPRSTFVRAGQRLTQSALLIQGIMSRYIDDRRGLRQLVAVHFPGDFPDLHAYPLKSLDHDVAAMTAATVAIISHDELDQIIEEMPQLTRKLWFATALDAAIHRAWLFRLGRLDAVGRVAHFLCETNARLVSAGLSDGRRFALDLTQSDLAEICGLTSVHVNRVMRTLREERLCTFRSSLVEIIDPERLAIRGEFNPAYLYIDSARNDAPGRDGYLTQPLVSGQDPQRVG